MSSMPQRLALLLAAVVAAAITIAGLFLDNRIGGALLLVTVAILVALARLRWAELPPNGRILRVVIVAAFAALAIARLITG
jgi:hypothetical protein